MDSVLFNVLATLFNGVLPIVLLTCWVVAEFRWRRSVRLALGLACLLFPCLWMWAGISSVNARAILHGAAFEMIDRSLEEGREVQVRKALQAYRETLEETGCSLSAVMRLNNTLLENGSALQQPEVQPSQFGKSKPDTDAPDANASGRWQAQEKP